MRLLFIPLISFLLTLQINGQIQRSTAQQIPLDTLSQNDEIIKNRSQADSLKIFRPTIEDYQIFNEEGMRKHLDTVLTHDKTFIFTQYNNQDNFGRIPFSNIGSGFNPITYSHNSLGNLALLPTNKSYFLLSTKDIEYYDVKTPTTAFVYHNGMNNGAALTSTYTQNFRKNFNVSAQYMGLRSAGNYNFQLAASNHLLFTTNFKSKSEKYHLLAHFLDQNIRNEENGGIQDDALFLSGESTIRNRANLLTRLSHANTRFSMRRYYLSHQFTPFDESVIPVRLRHRMNYQLNKYFYGEPNVQEMYYNDDSELIQYPTHTGKYSKNLSNTLSLVWDRDAFELGAGLRHQWIRVGIADEWNSSIISLPSQKSEQRIGAVAHLNMMLGAVFRLKSSAEISRGHLLGNYLATENIIQFSPIKNYWLKAHVDFQSSYPSLNFMLNASPYAKHNYFREDFKNQNTLSVGGVLGVPWYNSSVFGSFKNINHYTYLNHDGIPEQSDQALSLAEMGGETTLKYRDFYLNTRVLFQKVLQSKTLLPLPDLIARANLFYQSKVLKKAAEIQTGIKVHYFSSFQSRAYFPLLNEFHLTPVPFTIGAKPIIDLYFNLKVKRMFLFIEGQNMLTALLKNTHYTAPHYPFQDFRLNLGIVWYLVH